jgi:lambda repressor-like predicted transcriptional regulator
LENEQLRTAIGRAGLSLDEFADTVGVDVKTVRRWLTGRTPYPQNRASVANALETTEHALWPEDVPAPGTTGAGEPAGHPTGDAIVGYAHATDLAAPDVDELLRAAAERIQIVIPYLGSDSGLVELLRAGGPNGGRVRLMIEEPDERTEP